jgi:hypothetical protein
MSTDPAGPDRPTDHAAGDEERDTCPRPQDASDPRQRTGGGSLWVLGAAVLAMVCCAGPAVLAALGVGAAGTLLGVSLGVMALAVAGALLLAAAVVLIARRR